MTNREPVKRGAERHQRPPVENTSTESAVPASKGAAKHKIDLASQSKSWLRHHKSTARESLLRLLLNAFTEFNDTCGTGYCVGAARAYVCRTEEYSPVEW